MLLLLLLLLSFVVVVVVEMFGAAHATNVYAGGDVNGDFIVNILDAVQLVQYVLGNINFNEDQIAAGDLNQDQGINILDVVAMMNIILYDANNIVTEFLYEDINISSESFGQLVGPPIYQGMITGYYFGKAG